MEDERTNKDMEKPEEIIDDIVDTLDGLHANMVEDATEIGQARDRFKAIRPRWAELGNAITNNPDAADVYASAVSALYSVRNDIKFIADQYTPISGLMGTISPSSDFMINATGTTASIVFSHLVLQESEWLQPVEQSRRERTKEGLRKLDPSLADTYDGIWEVLYGTRADPERGGLYIIRQVFDHFFDALAPDDKVRASEFWHPKEEPDVNQVTRRERLQYAAHTRIRNKTTAQRLIDSAKHVLDVYEALNRAHKRGVLDSAKAMGALKEMQAIIEDWVEAIFYS